MLFDLFYRISVITELSYCLLSVIMLSWRRSVLQTLIQSLTLFVFLNCSTSALLFSCCNYFYLYCFYFYFYFIFIFLLLFHVNSLQKTS